MTGRTLPPPGTPDVWWIDRTQTPPPGVDASADLSLAEAIGAPARRKRFLHARRAIRRILGSYLDLEPQALPIGITALGKLHLPRQFGLAFNISHCGGWTVLAVAAGTTIGIDAVDDDEFAHAGAGAVALVTGAQERAALAASGDLQAAERRLWVRKEALGKALGRGLLADLQAIEIGGDATCRPVATPSGMFHIIDCPTPTNVTAALCTPSPLRAPRLRNDAALQAGSAPREHHQNPSWWSKRA